MSNLVFVILLLCLSLPTWALTPKQWQAHKNYIARATELPVSEADFRRHLNIPSYVDSIRLSPLLGSYQKLNRSSRAYLKTALPGLRALSQQLVADEQLEKKLIALKNTNDLVWINTRLEAYADSATGFTQNLIDINTLFDFSIPQGNALLSQYRDITS